MKYLFITLKVQDGENQHTHRVLLACNDKKNVREAANEYASGYYGSSEEGIMINDNGWYYFNSSTIAVKVENVVELTKAEYKLMSDVFSGNVRIPTKEEVLAFLKEWGQKQGEITSNLGYPASHSESDELLMEDYFFLEGKKQWYPKISRMYSTKEQEIADYLRANKDKYVQLFS